MSECKKCGLEPYGPYHECGALPAGCVRGPRYVTHAGGFVHRYGQHCTECVDIESRPPKEFFTVTEAKPWIERDDDGLPTKLYL